MGKNETRAGRFVMPVIIRAFSAQKMRIIVSGEIFGIMHRKGTTMSRLDKRWKRRIYSSTPSALRARHPLIRLGPSKDAAVDPTLQVDDGPAPVPGPYLQPKPVERKIRSESIPADALVRKAS
jgi:hypothetical protein